MGLLLLYNLPYCAAYTEPRNATGHGREGGFIPYQYAASLPHSSKKGVGNATWNTAGERCRNVPFVKGKMESR